MSQQYTNALTPDVLAYEDVTFISPAQLAEMSDKAWILIEDRKSSAVRIATDGGIVRARDTGYHLMLDDSRRVNVALAREEVFTRTDEP